MENDEVIVPEAEEQVELTLEEQAPEPEEEKDWKAEALKQKAINQRLNKRIDLPTKKDVPDDIRKTVEQLSLAEKKRQFGYEHGLSPDETDAVFTFTPNPTKETLANPFVEGGLAKLRSKKRVDENTPSSSRGGRPLVIKADATPAEKQAAHEAWTRGWTPKR